MQEHNLESQADETRTETGEKVAVETRLTAEQFLSSRFEPDPNEPDEDTYWLRFPNGVECVENRAFWKKHLAELLEAFRDKSEAPLREELKSSEEIRSAEKKILLAEIEKNTWLREEIEQLKRELSGCDDMTMEEAIEMVDVKTAPPTPSEFYSTLAHCASYPSCDGNLEGIKHSEKCPLFGRKELSLFEFAAAYSNSLHAFAENALTLAANTKVELTELRAKLAEQKLTILKWELIAGANAARAQAAEAELAALREGATGLIKRLDLIMTWADSHFSKDLPIELNPWLDDLRKALSAAPERPTTGTTDGG